MLMRDLSQLLPALMSKNASTQPDKGRYHTLRHVYREGQGYHAHTHLDQAWPDALKAIEDLEFTCQDPWRKGRPDGQLWQLEDILVFLRYDLEQARANTKTVDVSEGRDVYLLPYILASLSQLYGRSETLTQGRLAWLVQELGEPFYLTDKTGERQKQRDEGLRAELRERAHAETPSHPGAGPLEVLRDQAVRTRREWDGVRKLYKATLRKFPQELIDAQIGALSPGQIPSRESDHLARTSVGARELVKLGAQEERRSGSRELATSRAAVTSASARSRARDHSSPGTTPRPSAQLALETQPARPRSAGISGAAIRCGRGSTSKKSSLWTTCGHRLDIGWTSVGHRLDIPSAPELRAARAGVPFSELSWTSLGHRLDIAWTLLGHGLDKLWTTSGKKGARPTK